MSDGGARSRSLAAKSGTLAAATVLAGAGLVSTMPAAPPVAVASARVVQQDVELAAAPGSFLDAVQNLLDLIHLGTIDEVLAMFGTVPDSSPAVDFSVSSTVSQLLESLNPHDLTLGQIFGQLGIPLALPLYSDSGESLLGSDTFTIAGMTVDNPFVFTAPSSFYTTDWSGDDVSNLYGNINGTPLGDVDLGKLVDLLLGGAGEGDNHSLPELIESLGFDLDQKLPNIGGLGGFLDWVTNLVLGTTTYKEVLSQAAGLLNNFNVVENDCTPALGVCDNDYEHPTLSLNSSLNDWLSGLLQKSTTDVTRIAHSWSGLGLLGHEVTTETTLPDSGTTLGGYLETLPWGTDQNDYLGDQTLGDLLGMDPEETWSAYLSDMFFGGTLFHPGTETWGSQTIGELLTSWLPDGSGLTITDATSITDILEALFGL